LSEYERLARLSDQLADYLSGKRKPANIEERLDLAHICEIRGRFVAEVRFLQEVLAADPAVAESPNQMWRSTAARAALRAAAGKGAEAGGPDEAERQRLRRQALAWLKADLKRLMGLLGSEQPSQRRFALGSLRLLQTDEALTSFRTVEGRAGLPEAEAREWAEFWTQAERALPSETSKKKD
jgi:hypothetical protein